MPIVTIVGAGVIGISWARLFAGAGWEVRVSDPRPDLEQALQGIDAAAVADLAGRCATRTSSRRTARSGWS